LNSILHPFYTKFFKALAGFNKREWPISSKVLNLFILPTKAAFTFTFIANPEETKRHTSRAFHDSGRALASMQPAEPARAQI